MSTSMQATEASLGMMNAAGSVNDAKSSAEMVSGLGQLAATAVSLATNPAVAGLSIATNAGAAATTAGKVLSDHQAGREIQLADLASIAGNVMSIAAVIALNVNPASNAARTIGLVGRGLGWLGIGLYGWEKVPAHVKEKVNAAKNWTWPRDPIILDLDGDGLETVGLASNIHFDHDSDGVLTQTGWAGRDDALLVWDRNANGTIDTGAELFGDFTVLPNGALAPNGFAALAALDANSDGILDAADPAFAELKLWRDISQDGVSQGGEFITLADAGIVSLNLANTLKNQRLANGNTLSREGSFTRANGSTGGMGEFKLAADTFDTKFAETIDVPDALKTLPTMIGAGNVRALQQAAAQSGSVADLLTQFQSASTRTEQQALLDQLITAWADSSGMAGTLEERAAGKYRIQYEAFGNERRSGNLNVASDVTAATNSVGSGSALMSDAGDATLSDRYRNLISEWSRKLHVLEAFNGQYFFNLPEMKNQTDDANDSNWKVAA